MKPWQLGKILPDLRQQYSSLGDTHFAMMTASQQQDDQQKALLEEMLQITGLSSQDIKVPLSHPCAGKHIGYLAWMKAKGEKLEHYLDPKHDVYQYELPIQDVSHDGCGMPNAAFSAQQLAELYAQLACEDHPVGKIMRAYPLLIGGHGRLDTRILSGEFPPVAIAKEGADGLLGLGFPSCSPFPKGAGALIKLSHGYRPDDLEKVLKGLFEHLGLLKSHVLIKHQRMQWHWQ